MGWDTQPRSAARFAWVAAPAIVLACALAVDAGGAAAAKRCAGQDAPAGSVSNARAEKALLCVINRARHRRGLEKLSRHDELDRAAAGHSKVMVVTGCFRHRCPGELNLGERLKEYLATGGQGYGENIANGVDRAGSPRTIVRAWLKDKGNRANVLDPDYEHVGIGVVRGTPGGSGSRGATYTADFGYVSSR